MAPIRTYTDWNKRPSDHEETIEPYRKYFFICEGANTETFYFQKLIDLRKTLGIHPLIDIRFIEKTEGDRDISYPRKLIEFADKEILAVRLNGLLVIRRTLVPVCISTDRGHFIPPLQR